MNLDRRVLEPPKILSIFKTGSNSYKPKNGEGYHLKDGKEYTIRLYPLDLTFEVIQDA